MAIAYNEKTDYYARIMPNGRVINRHKDYFGAYITPKGELLNAEKLRYLSPPFEYIYLPTGIFYDFITREYDYKDTFSIREELDLYVLRDLYESKENLEHERERFETEYKDTKVLAQMSQVEIDLCNLFINCFTSDKIKDTTGQLNGNSADIFDLTEVLGVPISFDIKRVKYSHDTYSRNITNELLLKEILVRHLGYHSVESNWNKTITTSSWNIYEQFYNYLLMDYNIQQVSRFNYDKEKGLYIERPLTEDHYYDEKDEQGNVIDTKSVLMNLRDFLISDSELRLKDEIQAIKRLVPINERTKYFR